MVNQTTLFLKEILNESRSLSQEIEKYLSINGKKYPLSEWVTLKEYVKRYNLESTSVVSNWISRGVVPPENIVVVSEMNDLKLIKAVPYR